MSGAPEFRVYQDQAGEYRWRLVAGNGQVIADGAEGYTRREDVHRALELIRGTTGQVVDL